jgi:peptidyl-prolyl cis-trans isomerase A (cyclophilin A)
MMETKGREWCFSPSGSQALTAFAVAVLMAGCGGGDVADDVRRSPLNAVSATTAAVYDRDDLYRFFAIAFGAAPGVTYMGQLVEAADHGLTIKQIVNIFTTKPQFLETYPASLSNQEYAHKLVDNVVGSSASPAAKAEAVADIVAALSLPDWTRGDITYAIFNNLAKKPADDAKWAGTARKMAYQVAYTKHFTETMKVDTTHLPALRAVVSEVTESSSTEGDLTAPIQAWLSAVPPAASSITTGSLSYGQAATFSIDGAQLGQGFQYTVAGCEQATLGPVSSAFRQTFTCKPGPALTVTARALQGGSEVLSQTFTVPKPQVTLATSLGAIVVELEPGKARATVDNFLAYVDSKFYDGTIFHRVVRNFVAQGGGFTGVGASTLTPKTGLRPPIALESNKGLSNLRGTIAMARTALPDSATSQFYFNSVNNTFLDYSSSTSPGYAVFGSVVSGLAVVDAMNGVATRTVGSYADVPVNDIVLNSAIRTR